MAYFLGSDVQVCITTEVSNHSIKITEASGDYSAAGEAAASPHRRAGRARRCGSTLRGAVVHVDGSVRTHAERSAKRCRHAVRTDRHHDDFGVACVLEAKSLFDGVGVIRIDFELNPSP